MGNHPSYRKTSTSNSLYIEPNSHHLNVGSKLVTGVSESNLHKLSSTSEESMFQELRQMNMINEMKRNKEMKSITQKDKSIPTVFRWKGKGGTVYLSGSFNNWKEKILLKKSDDVYYTIANCLPGHHSFKFFINGEWKHDTNQPTESNDFGTLNNFVDICADDLDVDFALNFDEAHSHKSSSDQDLRAIGVEYGQVIPSAPNPLTETKLRNLVPCQLPPYLGENVLNTVVGVHNDPSLLTNPYHVQLNHLYASSISSGVAALSVTVRYRNKYITTIFYKPIL